MTASEDDITAALGSLADGGEPVLYVLQSRLRRAAGPWLRVVALPTKDTMRTSVSGWSQIRTVVHRQPEVVLAPIDNDFERLTRRIRSLVLDHHYYDYRVVGRYEDGRAFLAAEVYSRPGVGQRIWPRRQPLSSVECDP